jgi:hypothetical protein
MESASSDNSVNFRAASHMARMIGDCVYPIPKGWRLYVVDEIKSKEQHSCIAGPFRSKISAKYFTDGNCLGSALLFG